MHSSRPPDPGRAAIIAGTAAMFFFSTATSKPETPWRRAIFHFRPAQSCSIRSREGHMRGKFLGIAVTVFVIGFVLLTGVSLWYYTLGRRPKLLVSTRITEKTGIPSSHATAPGEVLLISGGKATLYDTIAGKEKWRSDLGTAPATATAAPTPPPISRLKNANDPMRQIAEARIARRAAKLDQ